MIQVHATFNTQSSWIYDKQKLGNFLTIPQACLRNNNKADWKSFIQSTETSRQDVRDRFHVMCVDMDECLYTCSTTGPRHHRPVEVSDHVLRESFLNINEPMRYNHSIEFPWHGESTEGAVGHVITVDTKSWFPETAGADLRWSLSRIREMILVLHPGGPSLSWIIIAGCSFQNITRTGPESWQSIDPGYRRSKKISDYSKMQMPDFLFSGSSLSFAGALFVLAEALRPRVSRFFSWLFTVWEIGTLMGET